MKKFIPKFIFKIYHYLLALAGAIIYGFPSKKMIVIGVTGTSGKSTTVNLITEVFQKNGFKTASMSTIDFKINEKTEPNMLKMTMPGRFKIQKFFKKALNSGCKYMILEVTSEGIKQFRHKFIDFDGVVFTNLSKEHIESHGGFENYKKAKSKLFKALNKSKKNNKFLVLNAESEYSEYYSSFVKNVKTFFYGIKSEKAEITPEKINLQISLSGEFNIYNSLAAVCVGLSQDIDLNKILNVLKNIKEISGRMELIVKEPFRVYVDYAHTPDSLIKVYETIQKTLPANRQDLKIICVLGSCGGGRDKWKRPEMGKIANNYCSKIILTNEDPYDEDPEKILNEIEAGIFNKGKYERILDRKEAINRAMVLAGKDDVVVITGKGSEPWMCVANNKKIKWDDREIVKQEFNKIYK